MSTATMNLPALSVASIENYISAVNRVPMLTPEREHGLGVALKSNGDLAAASEMVSSSTERMWRSSASLSSVSFSTRALMIMAIVAMMLITMAANPWISGVR